jgi:hypothetical protein
MKMRFSRRWARVLAISTLVILGIAMIVPYVVPLGGYIPRVERMASEAALQPVRIDALRLHLLPRPHVTVYGVSVGEPAIAAVESVAVSPDLATLFFDTPVIGEVLLERPWVAPAAFAALGPRPKAKDAPPDAPAARVEQVRIRSGELRLASGTIGAIDAVIMLGENGMPSRIEVTQNRTMQATLEGDGRNFAVNVTGRDWRLPLGPALRFERLAAKGTLGARGLALHGIDVRLYRGSLAGHARLGWKGPWKLEGALTVKDVDVGPIVALFPSGSTLSGRLKAQPSFSSSAPNASALADMLQLETDFEISEGMLKRVDLAAAARSIFGKNDNKGGETRFDQLSGHLGIDADGYHFSDLSIVSGLLKAGGEVSIGRSRALAGEITVEVRGTASLIATPLAISGTVDAPVVMPTKAALAGAAVGTAILPGIGTALGAKAGQLTKRLFGGGPRKPPEGGEARKPPAENGGGR